MKIRGTVEIEGMTLNVLIDAPDDTTELYVTNISSRCLVIPKERWLVCYLGLSKETFQELTAKGFMTLDHVLDAAWKVRDDIPLTVPAMDELKKQVHVFLERALIFPDLGILQAREKKETFPIRKKQQRTAAMREKSDTATTPAPLLGQRSLSGFLPANIVKTLQVQHGIETIDDLLQLGKVRVFMTKGLSKADVSRIDDYLRNHGLSYRDPLEKKEDVDNG